MLSRLQTLWASTQASREAAHVYLAPRAPWLWLLAFALLVSFAYTNPQLERLPPARPEAHGDGIYYYAYLRSLAFDRDVDFTNDYHLLGDQFHAGINPITKRPQNVFTMGPSLFWMPMVPVARAAQRVSEWLGAPPHTLDGSELTFQRVVLYGSTLAGFVTIALGLLLSLRLTSRGYATLASIGLCIGSPLLWFMLRQPSFSHAVDACAAALFASAWLVRFGSRALWQWLGMGLLLGLAMVVRPQNVAHVILPLSEWLILAAPLVRAGDARGLAKWVGTGALFVLGIAVAFSPLLYVWRSIYGEWTLVPQGADFMDWSHSRWDATLFSSRSGLFAWHPLILLSVVGLGVLACSRRYARELRLFAVLGIVVLLMQSYINGAAKDWWGGWAFGGRRFMSCTLYFMAGLAVMLETLRRFIVHKPERTAKLCALALVGAFFLFNRSLADDYLYSRILPDAAQPMKPRYASAMLKTLDEAYALVGNPGSWPANWWFAWRAGRSPELYDVAAANDLYEPAGEDEVPMDDAHAMRGFEPTSTAYQGRSARIARERELTWVFTLRRQTKMLGLVTISAPLPGTRIRMEMNGITVLNTEVPRSWQDITFELPEAATNTGVVFVHVTQTLPRRGAYVAWERAYLAFDKRPDPLPEGEEPAEEPAEGDDERRSE